VQVMENIQQLKHKWALWETYIQSNEPNTNKNNVAYMDNLNLIQEFNTLEDFALIWSNLPHSNPSQFFHEHGERSIKKVRISDTQMKQIDSVAVFKNRIKPAWEDPENAKGGEFHLRLVDPYPPEIDELWKAVIFDLMSGDLEMVDKINGIRIVDKSKPPRNNTRLEVWVDFRDETSKKAMEQILIQKYCKGDFIGDKLQPKPEWRDHASH